MRWGRGCNNFLMKAISHMTEIAFYYYKLKSWGPILQIFINKFVKALTSVPLLIFLSTPVYLSSFKAPFPFVSISYFNLLTQFKHIIEQGGGRWGFAGSGPWRLWYYCFSCKMQFLQGLLTCSPLWICQQVLLCNLSPTLLRWWKLIFPSYDTNSPVTSWTLPLVKMPQI